MKRLQWLGPMADNRMPKSVLFGWLSEPRPRYGPRKRWRDIIRKDLAYIGVDENKWYEEATKSRAGWRALCHCGITAHQDEIQVPHGQPSANNVVCEVCSRGRVTGRGTSV